jgi:BlaI family penicillinase repressor
MPTPPSITEAEWHVMKVLWDAPANQWLTAAAVVEPVARDRGVHHRTARTLLARLVKKGAVDARPDGPGTGHLYRAKISRDAAVRKESRSFLSRVFDGDAAPALVHLLEESRAHLSPEQLQELRDLLDKKGKP